MNKERERGKRGWGTRQKKKRKHTINRKFGPRDQIPVKYNAKF